MTEIPEASPEYFQRHGWETPEQIRDYLLGRFDLTTDYIQKVRVLAIQEADRRKNSGDYVRCNRCKGWHDQKENLEELCERCEAATAPLRYDLAQGLTAYKNIWTGSAEK